MRTLTVAIARASGSTQSATSPGSSPRLRVWGADRASLPPRHRRRGLRRPKPCRGRKVTPAKKAPRGAKTAETAGAREGSKTAKVLELLKRPGAATAKELMKATGLQPHSVLGFLSGTVGKKMGLVITSAKGEDGERSYSVKA